MSAAAASLSPGTPRFNRLIWTLILISLLFAPLIMGGNRALPRLVLECLALGTALLLWVRGTLCPPVNSTLLAVGLILLVVPLLQLVPLPPWVWSWLPQADYRVVDAAWQPLSLLPELTLAAWLALLPPLVLFAAAVQLPTRLLEDLIPPLLILGVLLAMLVLIQVHMPAGSVWHLGQSASAGTGFGTFRSRNHMAGMLEMLLPLALAYLAAEVVLSRHRGRSGLRDDRHFARVVLFSALAIGLFVGLVFTRSRAGVGLGLLAFVLAAIVFVGHPQGKRWRRWVIGIGGIAVLLVLAIGVWPVLERFSGSEVIDGYRRIIWDTTLAAIVEFLPFGSGMGTYAQVYPPFQSAEIAGFVNRAHNDYLEWLMEGGVPILFAMVLLAMAWVSRWRELLADRHWSRFGFLQIGAGLGMTLMLLHSLVDFNLHIPANGLIFAFLAALFFHTEHRRYHPHRQHHAPVVASAQSPPAPRRIPPENLVNPFDEPVKPANRSHATTVEEWH